MNLTKVTSSIGVIITSISIGVISTTNANAQTFPSFPPLPAFPTPAPAPAPAPAPGTVTGSGQAGVGSQAFGANPAYIGTATGTATSPTTAQSTSVVNLTKTPGGANVPPSQVTLDLLRKSWKDRQNL